MEIYKKSIQNLCDVYMHRKVLLLQEIVRANHSNPLRQVTLENNSVKPIDFAPKCVGGPKKRWATEALITYWDRIRHLLPADMHTASFDVKNRVHGNIIQVAANSLMYR